MSDIIFGPKNSRKTECYELYDALSKLIYGIGLAFDVCGTTMTDAHFEYLEKIANYALVNGAEVYLLPKHIKDLKEALKTGDAEKIKNASERLHSDVLSLEWSLLGIMWSRCFKT